MLWQYDLQEPVPDAVLEDLTTVAAALCGVPMAAVSVVGEDRVWFLARIGFKLDQVPLRNSLCAHAIEQNGIFIVPDLLQHPRFRRHPIVRSGPRLRFYAGMPIVTAAGVPLGALCVMDVVPHTLSPEQQHGLTALARLVAIQLDLRRQRRELEQIQMRVEQTCTDLVRVLECTPGRHVPGTTGE